ncbi:MAG: hypothetical protein IT392_12290 [Nitrospirae bacterium]|nr:hypothetical protein [Nitrospirota bacterium]
MRFIRLRTAALVVLIIIVAALLWLLIPLHPSARKDTLYGQAYITGVVRIKPLLDKPFSAFVSAIPGNPAAAGNVPFFLRPLIPPVMEFYLQGSKEGNGWAIVTDLGWRSKLFRMFHGIIIGQMQYRGMGAVEGESVLRAPSGQRILLYQDGRTLFFAEGENIIDKIIGPVSTANPAADRSDLQISGSETSDNRIISSVSFSNIDGDVTKAIESLEGRAGFVLMPSAGSMVKGSFDIRQTGSDTISGMIALTGREDGDFEGLEGDITYLVSLLERYLYAQNMKTDVTINREESTITAQIMIHPEGGKQ